jgi:hypothetical protein
VLRLLRDFGPQIAEVGLFVTCSGTSPQYPPERAIEEMTRAAAGKVLSTAIFREAALTFGAWRDQARGFAASIGAAHRLAAPMPPSHADL